MTREEAERRVLLLESLDRDPPAPEIDSEDIQAAEEVYRGEVTEWTPDDE